MSSRSADFGSNPVYSDTRPEPPLRIVRKTRSLTNDSNQEGSGRPGLATFHSTGDVSTRASLPSRIRHLPQIKQSSPQDVRPLPLPPAPLSAPVATKGTCRTIRPLPSPPTPPPETELKPTICVTPATPLPPPTPNAGSMVHLSPPSSFSKPRSYGSLCLQTSPDVLTTFIAEEDEGDWASSPLTPSIPQRPSPSVARRKRMSKLRRHLGESVTDSMLPMNKDQTQKLLTALAEDPGSTADLNDLIFHKNVDSEEQEPEEQDLVEDGSSTSEDDDSLFTLDDDSSDKLWVVDGTTFRAATLRRYSKKWIREKGGHRWEEDDYTHILRALRSL
ncbi:hypothetical protein VNI00_005445 [Paramarasmius palmivorus]|uniref:Uncharacterized protein n=1 Tax=Paramarasmius palmivorus TaxID=297713 RepID=A0AAW0DHS6_9AGAR